MRLAFYTYSYTDRLEMPVEACLERIDHLGYAGIDGSGTHGTSEDPASVGANRKIMYRAGIIVRVDSTARILSFMIYSSTANSNTRYETVR